MLLRRKSSLRLPLGILHQCRGFQSGTGPLQANLATSTRPSGGFLSSLFGGTAPSLPPMYEELPGIATVPYPKDVPAPETKITTLSNGLKIASENRMGPTMTLGIYIDCGSSYEPAEVAGVSHLLERMAFKSTANRTHFRVIRDVEAIGGNVLASASREQMSYTSDAMKTCLPEALEILADTVRNSVYHDWEVSEQIQRIRSELAEVAKNPLTVVQEAMQSFAYAGALGRPLLAPEANLGRLSGATCLDFVSEHYTAPRMVLAASGVDHAELMALAEPLLGDLPPSPTPALPPTQYVGGEWRQSADSPATHMALAFEFSGGWRNEQDAVVLTVMQTLLGGGGSFSAGGPGKGMLSRLYTRVLNQYGDVTSCTAFSTIYNNTGLFGIYGASTGAASSRLLDTMVKELQLLASPGSVTSVELERAKNATISSVLMSLESRAVVAEDIGRQILTYGHRKQPSEYVKMVEGVSLEDIQRLAKTLMSTPASLAAWGDVGSLPRYDQLVARFV